MVEIKRDERANSPRQRERERERKNQKVSSRSVPFFFFFFIRRIILTIEFFSFFFFFFSLFFGIREFLLKFSLLSILEVRVSPRPIYSVSIRPIAGINFLKNKPAWSRLTSHGKHAPPPDGSSSTRILFSFFHEANSSCITRDHSCLVRLKRNVVYSRIFFFFFFFNLVERNRLAIRSAREEKKRFEEDRGAELLVGGYVVCVTSSRPVNGWK